MQIFVLQNTDVVSWQTAVSVHVSASEGRVKEKTGFPAASRSISGAAQLGNGGCLPLLYFQGADSPEPKLGA